MTTDSPRWSLRSGVWAAWDELSAFRARSVVLAIGVAVSVAVFLFAVAIGEGNVDELHAAIDRTQGQRNTYALRLSSVDGQVWDDAYLPELRRIAGRTGRSVVVWQRVHTADTRCSAPQVSTFLVVDGAVDTLMSAGHRPLVLRRHPEDDPPALSGCALAGLEVRADVPRPTAATVATRSGEVLVDRSAFAGVAIGASIETGVLVNIPSVGDEERLRHDVEQLVAVFGALQDRPGAAVSLDRVDQAAAFSRAEASAHGVMYAFAGASMLLSCLGLALSYLAAFQQRRPALGLARAAGATRTVLATPVLIEILVVVSSGAALGTGLAATAAGRLHTAWGGPANVVSAGGVAAMGAALLVTSLVAAAGPCLRVIRMDVADVLANSA